jgi:hypothetical protein
MGADEPTARNSNLLPVKANGEVRLRSVWSFGRTGSEVAPSSRDPPCLEAEAAPFSSCSMTSSSCEPRKIETIAGGA